jgi:hypothetical protein
MVARGRGLDTGNRAEVRSSWSRLFTFDEEAEMVDVPLSMKEIEVIRFVIERYRKAMLFEIANTDSRELREHLVRREELIESLVQKLDSFSGPPDPLQD